MQARQNRRQPCLKVALEGGLNVPVKVQQLLQPPPQLWHGLLQVLLSAKGTSTNQAHIVSWLLLYTVLKMHL